jgi:hypothetical protein
VRLAFPDPPLSAGGIVLRRPEPGDIPWITAACSDRELSRHVPAIPYPYSQSDARASQRVAERAGFTREGLLRAWMPTAEGRRDSVMFSLLPDDPGHKIYEY